MRNTCDTQLAFDLVMGASDAGVWQQLVRPTLQGSTLAALQRLASDPCSAAPLGVSDARQLRAVVGYSPSKAPPPRALPSGPDQSPLPDQLCKYMNQYPTLCAAHIAR